MSWRGIPFKQGILPTHINLLLRLTTSQLIALPWLSTDSFLVIASDQHMQSLEFQFENSNTGGWRGLGISEIKNIGR